MTASLALASAARVPVSSWGGQGVVPSSGDEIVSFEGETCRGDEIIHHHRAGGAGGVFQGVDSVVDDSDEEMEPFDAERFVDRLVEDDPPSWRMAGMAGGDGVWEAAKASTSGSSAAKLFLQQPIYHWPSQQQLEQPHLLGGGPDFGSSQGLPMVVPHDPILDALFTPCRVVASASSAPTVTFGLARTDGRGAGGACLSKNGIPGFEPVPIYNIPPPAEAHPSSLQVPMAPLRQPSGGRYGYGAGGYSPGRSTTSMAIAIQSAIRGATYLNETNSNNIPGEFGSGPGTGAAATTAAAAATITPATAAAPLTGADAHSSQEYDDERHAFLRKQEMAVFVGPQYLSDGVLTQAERAAAVDWLSGLHAAAPAASGGGEPLSIETLFLAVNLMDRFLSTAEGARTVCAGSTGGGGGGMPGPGLKLAAAACLALSSKYQDTQAASLWGVAVASVSSTSSLPLPPSCALNHHLGGGGVDDGGVSGAVGVGDVFGVLGAGDGDVRAARKELAAMEMRVVSALGFRLTVPSAISFLGVFLRRAGALGYLPAEGDPGSSSERIRQEAQQILLCVLRDASSLEHPSSALAAAALYWSSCITAPATPPPSSFAFLAVTGYELGQLCRCLRDMEVVRTGGGGRYDSSGAGGGGGGGGGGESLFGGAAFPEHAGQSLFGAGGGHPAIAAL